MWRPPPKDKPEKPKPRLLPASGQQLSHAKADRAHLIGGASYFRDLTKNWAPVVRPKVVVEEQPEVAVDDPNMPPYLRRRPTTRSKPLFFRTGPGTRGGKK
jgi:hypothetical protein